MSPKQLRNRREGVVGGKKGRSWSIEPQPEKTVVSSNCRSSWDRTAAVSKQVADGCQSMQARFPKSLVDFGSDMEMGKQVVCFFQGSKGGGWDHFQWRIWCDCRQRTSQSAWLEGFNLNCFVGFSLELLAGVGVIEMTPEGWVLDVFRVVEGSQDLNSCLWGKNKVFKIIECLEESELESRGIRAGGTRTQSGSRQVWQNDCWVMTGSSTSRKAKVGEDSMWLNEHLVDN
jgi:hypothetical protein